MFTSHWIISRPPRISSKTLITFVFYFLIVLATILYRDISIFCKNNISICITNIFYDTLLFLFLFILTFYTYRYHNN